MKNFRFLPPWVFILLALAVAYGTEYGFQKHPCTYCLYQRYILMASALCFFHPRLFWGGVVSLFLGLALSFYQVGLESHWWEDLLAACSVQKNHAHSLEELRQTLTTQPIIPCNQVNWEILGVSVTLWTGLFQIILIPYSFFWRRSL